MPGVAAAVAVGALDAQGCPAAALPVAWSRSQRTLGIGPPTMSPVANGDHDMKLRRPLAAWCLGLLVGPGCGDPSPDATPPADAASTEAARPGIRFDPGTLRPGARIGTLVVDSVEARRSVVDSTYVGLARFRGALELSGRTLRHPDPDSRATCFEADAASAARMPRWSGDERRAWFCFENGTEAAQALGPPSEGVEATLVVDRFTIHRGLTDEVNSARFVRLVRGGAAARPTG